MLYTKEQLVKLYNDTVMEFLNAGYMLTGAHSSRELILKKGPERATIEFHLWRRECDMVVSTINTDTGEKGEKEFHYEEPSFGLNCPGFIYESDNNVIKANMEKSRVRYTNRCFLNPSYWSEDEQYKFTGTSLKYASYIVLPAVKRVKGYSRIRVDDIKSIARIKGIGEIFYYSVSVVKKETVVLPMKK